MPYPIISIEIASTNPFDAIDQQRNDFLSRGLCGNQIWKDLSSTVLFLETKRGRQLELDRVETGTALIVLDNRDRRFDPSNELSPFFDWLHPLRKIRIVARIFDVSYYLFVGYIQSISQKWNGMNAQTHIFLTDAFGPLALMSLSNTFPIQSSGERINAILDAISWPINDRVIDAGKSELQAESSEIQTRALEYLHTVASWENGVIFVDSLGRIVFRDRHARILTSTISATLGDGPNELPYQNFEPIFDDTHIYNDVVVSQRNGITATASDQTSQSIYLKRSLKRELAISSALETQSAADWLLSRYSKPAHRISQIIINPSGNSDLWPHVLGREIGDKIRILRRPPGGGNPQEYLMYIEGIEHRVERGLWETIWKLSPASWDDFWILGDITRGVLGSTTRLAY